MKKGLRLLKKWKHILACFIHGPYIKLIASITIAEAIFVVEENMKGDN